MSMSISCAGCGLEYAGGRGLSGSAADRAHGRVGAVPANAARGRALPPARERPCSRATRHRDAARVPGRQAGSRAYFVRTSSRRCRGRLVDARRPGRGLPGPVPVLVPAQPRLLAVTGSPVWYTVAGGSARYVERVAKGLTAVQTSTPGAAVTRVGAGVEIRDDADSVGDASTASSWPTHPHQALGMLAEPTRDEREVLGAIGYTVNPTVLHTDAVDAAAARRAPRRPGTTRCPRATPRRPRVQVSYNMNRLQRLDADRTPTSSRSTARTRIDPRDRARPHGVRAPRLHDRLGRAPASACPSSTTASWPSPVPTTAGDSTRTAAVPGWTRPRASACDW